jgi:hypothetical protein
MRLTLAILGALALASAIGCGPGPKHNRLYVSEWKSKKSHPIQLEKDWEYEGEYMEHTKRVEHKKYDW